MSATSKISVALGVEELQFVKKVAKLEGCSVSSLITRAVRAQMAEHELLVAAREYVATFSKKEKGTPADHDAFFARLASPPPSGSRRSTKTSGRKRAA